ncbi:hypothetical protein GCM10007416_05130 [Kroppenstedtia guangzhouensis]|uniref:Uncharacterized protein n=1 Tax=Kroppenstedtia guangzhouensis TaxID=1274356 RepID=A0ABQ1G0W2_9BACL|nr:hypothetical protein [Kroppenstedtia guangzhouensis]GGA35258.1 hypothetical protein GCM10007416_05130 [Kroppenstedtia guangzhouensis]
MKKYGVTVRYAGDLVGDFFFEAETAEKACLMAIEEAKLVMGGGESDGEFICVPVIWE